MDIDGFEFPDNSHLNLWTDDLKILIDEDEADMTDEEYEKMLDKPRDRNIVRTNRCSIFLVVFVVNEISIEV